MKFRTLVMTGLLAVLLSAACAPVAAPVTVQPDAPVQAAPPTIEPPAQPTPLPGDVQPEAARTEALPTETLAEAPQSVPTSRGPDLESTDPAGVSLASGNLQLVEFFRYT